MDYQLEVSVSVRLRMDDGSTVVDRFTLESQRYAYEFFHALVNEEVFQGVVGQEIKDCVKRVEARKVS